MLSVRIQFPSTPSHKDYDHGFEYDKIRPSLLYRPPGGYDPNICTGCCHVIIIECARVTCPAPALGCCTHVSVQDLSPLEVSRVTYINFQISILKALLYCFIISENVKLLSPRSISIFNILENVK